MNHKVMLLTWNEGSMCNSTWNHFDEHFKAQAFGQVEYSFAHRVLLSVPQLSVIVVSPREELSIASSLRVILLRCLNLLRLQWVSLKLLLIEGIASWVINVGRCASYDWACELGSPAASVYFIVSSRRWMRHHYCFNYKSTVKLIKSIVSNIII
jgi:hypothetical protein